jgi:tetratricopeptide (TPR) repeat protein
MTKREKAEALNTRAIQLEERGQLKEAVALYEQAAAADPRWSSPLFNLGLLYKNHRKWKKSLHYNRRATDVDPANEGAWWNLGIAATALGRWRTARLAWRGFGIDMPHGDGPIDFPCGYGPIRLHPQGEAEVVWADRIDPARAVLTNIPFPESNYRWRDIVLNDGAPNGYRQYHGKEVPVLDALQLLEASPFGTYVARVEVPPGRDLTEKLAQIAADLGGSAEDWSTSIRLLCKACSEGRAHEFHDTEAPPAEGVHLIGIAARGREQAEEILATWEAGADDIHVEYLEDALEPGPPDTSWSPDDES